MSTNAMAELTPVVAGLLCRSQPDGGAGGG